MWVTRFAKSHLIFISKSQFLSLADGKSKSITPLRINLNCTLCEQSQDVERCLMTMAIHPMRKLDTYITRR